MLAHIVYSPSLSLSLSLSLNTNVTGMCGDGKCDTDIETCITCFEDCASTCMSFFFLRFDLFLLFYSFYLFLILFIYILGPVACPAPCVNGTCGSNGKCICTGSYTGPTCDSNLFLFLFIFLFFIILILTFYLFQVSINLSQSNSIQHIPISLSSLPPRMHLVSVFPFWD